MDFKLTLTPETIVDASRLDSIAFAIYDEFGADFDAARGDFVATADGGSIVVIAKDVAAGDMRHLVDRIAESFRDVDFTVAAAYRETDGPSTWWSTELDGDDD